MSAFARFDPLLQEKIVSNLGWTSLREVQELASEAILDGKNCVVLAPTAGGKTEAAIFPVLSGCLTNQESGLRVLYICPTRALINNQEERLGGYAGMLGLGAFKWHGDVTPAQKKQFLREPCELVLTTPESLEVMLASERVPTARLFRNLKYVVVDEIHALAACDRGNHLLCVLERLRPYCRNDFQRIGLSATVGNPEHVLNWLQGSSTNPRALISPPGVRGKKDIVIQLATEPDDIESQVLAAARGGKSLLFCESRRLAERISGALKKTGESVFAHHVFTHHSSLSREEREAAEHQFTRGTEACIVCTSTMELGIDVGDLDRVLQINAPNTISSFLQRMGRTGRRPRTTANTTFFIEKEQFFLQAVAIVELARTHWVERIRTSNKAWHILLHQIMALCLERGGITKNLPWRVLGKASCFAGIDEAGFLWFTNYLLSMDFLHDDGGMLSMGLEAEKVFGRRNFMELYSVFSSPTEFEVVGVSGDVIGSVEWDFLESLMEGNAAFYLSGKAWAVERIEWKKKVVYVTRAPAGKVPKWGGLSPSFLGYELCRKERDVLVADYDYPYLAAEAQAWLRDLRTDKRNFLSTDFAPIEQDEKGIIWWTYAGGYVNNTLRYALKIKLNAEVQATNECIKVVSETVSWSEFSRVLQEMEEPGHWDDDELLDAINRMMPDYRLSKFQRYLPPDLQRSLVADTILDIHNTVSFLRGEPV